jgi:hypothetical protein
VPSTRTDVGRAFSVATRWRRGEQGKHVLPFRLSPMRLELNYFSTRVRRTREHMGLKNNPIPGRLMCGFGGRCDTWRSIPWWLFRRGRVRAPGQALSEGLAGALLDPSPAKLREAARSCAKLVAIVSLYLHAHSELRVFTKVHLYQLEVQHGRLRLRCTQLALVLVRRRARDSLPSSLTGLHRPCPCPWSSTAVVSFKKVSNVLFQCYKKE